MGVLLCVEIWRDGGGDVWITSAGALWAVAYASHRASALVLLPVAFAHVARGVVADKAAAKSLGLRAGLGCKPEESIGNAIVCFRFQVPKCPGLNI